MIRVRQIDDSTFKVTVTGRDTTQHNVKLESSYYQHLTGGQVPAPRLIEKSFEFLLQREPNTAILPQFDLTIISHYFPEYECEIRDMLNC
jgi:hypothetical protein